MCNLYRLDPSQQVFQFTADEIARFNVPTEVYPNYPGVVVESGRLRSMNWGFPVRLKHMKPTSKPMPVNNTRDDKLRSFMWRDSFERRRCLIPVTQWAEAEGERGRMTRTWCGLPDGDTFMVAGLWQPTDEWGDCYSMIMTDSSPQMATVHDRMPVLLASDDFKQWTDGTPDEALALVRAWPGELAITRTSDPWRQSVNKPG